MGMQSRCAEPPAWPPEDGYKEHGGGWHASNSSKDWLYKPTAGIYYHTPTETLWKRMDASHKKKYVRVDSTSLDRLAIVTFGSVSAPARVLRRVCFAAWRAELSKVDKFEAMERELAGGEGCIEAKIAPPRQSAPCAAGYARAAAMARAGDSAREGASLQENYLGAGSWFLDLLSMLPGPTRAVSCGSDSPTKSPAGTSGLASRLTTAHMVRHNMRPTLNKAISRQPTIIGGKVLQPQALSLFHQECEAWRQHVRSRGSEISVVVDDTLGLHVGDSVRFDGDRTGIIERAFVPMDEYAVSCNGDLISLESGEVRYFKADHLFPVACTGGAELAEQEALAIACPQSASARGILVWTS